MKHSCILSNSFGRHHQEACPCIFGGCHFSRALSGKPRLQRAAFAAACCPYNSLPHLLQLTCALEALSWSWKAKIGALAAVMRLCTSLPAGRLGVRKTAPAGPARLAVMSGCAAAALMAYLPSLQLCGMSTGGCVTSVGVPATAKQGHYHLGRRADALMRRTEQ